MHRRIIWCCASGWVTWGFSSNSVVSNLCNLSQALYRNYLKCLVRMVLTNNADPDQPISDQGLHCLVFQLQIGHVCIFNLMSVTAVCMYVQTFGVFTMICIIIIMYYNYYVRMLLYVLFFSHSCAV